MASATVMRLQTVVSREVAMADNAVVTVGTIQSGFNENVIPDEALLRLNIRTFKEAVRSRVLDSVKRIIEAEATPSRSDESRVGNGWVSSCKTLWSHVTE